MQTVKCRAVPIDKPNGKQVWKVSHPDVSYVVEMFRPHDIALMMVHDALRAQLEPSCRR